jgi:hypothetical protein
LGAVVEKAFYKHRSKMEKEKPDVAKKLSDYFSLSAEEAFKGKKS